MFSLRSFVGDLKDALIEAEGDEEDEEEVEEQLNQQEIVASKVLVPFAAPTVSSSVLEQQRVTTPPLPASATVAVGDPGAPTRHAYAVREFAPPVGYSARLAEEADTCAGQNSAACHSPSSTSAPFNPVPPASPATSAAWASQFDAANLQTMPTPPPGRRPAVSSAPTIELTAQMPLPDAPAPPMNSATPTTSISYVQGTAPAALESQEQLSAEDGEAYQHFKALVATPGLLELLQECGVNTDGDGIWAGDGRPATSKIASQCAEALRRVTPRALAMDNGSDRQHLLASFSDRYDALLAEHTALQQRCQQMGAWQDAYTGLAQQVEVWQSAHQAATTRVEELTLENADLKVKVQARERRDIEPAEKQRLLQCLAQREAELKAVGDALQQLHEVMEDGTGEANARCAELEQQLTDARHALNAAENALQSEVVRSREARQEAASAAAREETYAVQARNAEREAMETNTALEALLQEKAKHLEERENHVDKRLVTSMLGLYQDHLSSGQTSLAEQVLSQTMQVIGGAPAMTDRQRLFATREAKPAGPLGDAFLDFLDKETSEAAASDARTILASNG